MSRLRRKAGLDSKAGPFSPNKWAWPPPGVRKEAWQASEQICREAISRSNTNVCSLAFSTGKDSLALMLVLREFFAQVVPVFWYLVPGLGFVERSLRHYEQMFGWPVLRLPHPDRFALIADWVFQPPYRLTALEAIFEDVPDYTMDSLFAEVRQEYGLATIGGRAGALHATGIRAADSPVRAGLYKKFGGFAPNGLLFYPVITWSIDDIEACLDAAGVVLPPEYAWIGRSFDGIMRRYLQPIKEHYPEDYLRIVDDFPMVELEFYRAEQVAGLENIKPLYKEIGKDT